MKDGIHKKSSRVSSLSLEEMKSALIGDQDQITLIISDHLVWNLYGKHFQNLGKNCFHWIGPEGEDLKTPKNYLTCMEFFLSKGLQRGTRLVALGGGAVSDFAGFVASTLLRGIPWSVIPTTLLGMVDASLGGKTGLNSQWGKNLIGTFYPPENIWMNSLFLDTLSPQEVLSGKGEILKYALLNPDIFKAIINKSATLEELVELCAGHKLAVVEEDMYELGARMSLNLGHTFGHAFEKLLALPHGLAVVLGIEFILRYIDNSFQKEKLLLDFNKLKKCLEGDTPFPSLTEGFLKKLDKKQLLNFLAKDKKRPNQSSLRLILLKDIGAFYTKDFSWDEIEEKVRGL